VRGGVGWDEMNGVYSNLEESGMVRWIKEGLVMVHMSV